jgi:acyl-CoA reductase-like NAD-dependent aldehyde dehydrogenase
MNFVHAPLEASDVDAMVARAVAAQREFETWSEPRVDALLREVAQTIDAHAEPLAVAAVEETGLGNVRDKTLKNRLASAAVYAAMAGQSGVGRLGSAPSGVTEIASPVGVVFGLVPRTHPVATFVFKVLIALKARNALILSSHRAALEVSNQTGDLVVDVLVRHGAPLGLVQWVRVRAGREVTLGFMQHPHVGLILATGGANMVRAAYSSGTPAIGVGPGNTPTWVRADADPARVADAVMASKTFDNGVACSSEHNLVVDRRIELPLVQALTARGATLVRPAEVPAVVERVFDPETGHVRGELVGRTANELLAAAGLHRAEDVQLLLVPASERELSGPLGHEKLAPVLSLFSVASDDAAIALCQRLLDEDGSGHTAIVHTRERAAMERFAGAMRVSRVLINVPGLQGSIGIGTGLPMSMTLGTGTCGGTSTTDNVTFRHLQNIKRVAESFVGAGD